MGQFLRENPELSCWCELLSQPQHLKAVRLMRLKRLWSNAVVLALFALLSVLTVVAAEQDYYKVGALCGNLLHFVCT